MTSSEYKEIMQKLSKGSKYLEITHIEEYGPDTHKCYMVTIEFGEFRMWLTDRYPARSDLDREIDIKVSNRIIGTFQNLGDLSQIHLISLGESEILVFRSSFPHTEYIKRYYPNGESEIMMIEHEQFKIQT